MDGVKRELRAKEASLVTSKLTCRTSMDWFSKACNAHEEGYFLKESYKKIERGLQVLGIVDFVRF